MFEMFQAPAITTNWIDIKSYLFILKVAEAFGLKIDG
jgi:hypothetical protein